MTTEEPTTVPFFAPIVKSLLRSAGYYRRRLAVDDSAGVVVLCYHGVLPNNADRTTIPFEQLHVSARRLEQQCQVLAEYCRPVGMQEFAELIQDGCSRDRAAGRRRLPVLLTFDDGYANLWNVATPILERYSVPATVFACTEPMETGELLWTDRAAAAFGEREVERLKSVLDQERRAIVSQTSRSPFEHGHCRLMSADELRRLVGHPLWSVGGHTHTHPVLARCSPEVQREEIERNLARLETVVGRRPSTFAYPNGRPGRDYDDATRELLGASGVKFAFTTEAGFATDASRPLDLPRMFMLDGVTGVELLHRLAVSWRR